jgi:hypothetical protein
MTKRLAAEMAIVTAIFVAVEWLATTLTHAELLGAAHGVGRLPGYSSGDRSAPAAIVTDQPFYSPTHKPAPVRTTR